MPNEAEGRKVALAAFLAVLFYRLQDDKCRAARQRLSRETVRDGSGAMFELVAPRYDFVNNVISLGLHRGWKRTAVDAALKPFLVASSERAELQVLDLATGTADLAIDIAQRYGSYVKQVVAVDPCSRMLDIASRKLARAQVSDKVLLVKGVAEELPQEWTNRFDVCIIGFGVRNFADRKKGLCEVWRVLKKAEASTATPTDPVSRLVVLEITEPRGRSIAAPIARFFLRTCVPLLGALFSLRLREYCYLQRSARLFPPLDEFLEAMRDECCLETIRAQRLPPFGLGPALIIVKPAPKQASVEAAALAPEDAFVNSSATPSRSSTDAPWHVESAPRNDERDAPGVAPPSSVVA